MLYRKGVVRGDERKIKQIHFPMKMETENLFMWGGFVKNIQHPVDNSNFLSRNNSNRKTNMRVEFKKRRNDFIMKLGYEGGCYGCETWNKSNRNMASTCIPRGILAETVFIRELKAIQCFGFLFKNTKRNFSFRRHSLCSVQTSTTAPSVSSVVRLTLVLGLGIGLSCLGTCWLLSFSLCDWV